MDKAAPRGTWDFRRGLAVRGLQYSAGVVAAALILPLNPDVAKTAITSAYTFAGAIIAAYLGTATTSDYLHRSPPADPPKPPPVKAPDGAIG